MKERPPPGTAIRANVDGAVRDGVVMPYEMEWDRCTFPVRFSDLVWRMMLLGEVEECSVIEGVDGRRCSVA